MPQISSGISKKRDWGSEQILVVKREHLFSGKDAWQGLARVNFDVFLNVIKEKQEFIPRAFAEEDEGYKQIIPYLIFNFADRYFLMKRKSKATEARLRDKYSLGIGGHIREADIKSDSIIDWAKREFNEEVHYSGKLEVEPLGILNDDSNSVGRVHIGFVFLLKGDNPNISIKSELESGQLVSLEQCNAIRSNLEEWSQIVLSHLESRI